MFSPWITSSSTQIIKDTFKTDSNFRIPKHLLFYRNRFFINHILCLQHSRIRKLKFQKNTLDHQKEYSISQNERGFYCSGYWYFINPITFVHTPCSDLIGTCGNVTSLCVYIALYNEVMNLGRRLAAELIRANLQKLTPLIHQRPLALCEQ